MLSRPFRLFIATIAIFTLVGCTGSVTGDGTEDPEFPNGEPNPNNRQNPNNGNNTNNQTNNQTNNPTNNPTNNQTNNQTNNPTNNQTNNTNNVDPCAELTCGTNAACVGGGCMCDAGFAGDPTTGCTPADPCADVTCPAGASCAQGQCSCDPGFVDDGNNGCVAESPGDTATRTRTQVCDRWTADYPTQSQMTWQVDPVDTCDPGVLHPDVQQDALRRLSLFRWIVGLPAVTTSSAQLVNTQSCATTLAAEGAGLTHNIPSTYQCYSQEAAAGASSSNISLGRTHPADSVDLYVGDRGVRSLGHRRWCLNPSMGATAFGQRGSYSCMYAFDRSGQASPEYVAYPAPGFFPDAALQGYWSFGSNQYGVSNATVSMTRVSDGSAVQVDDIYTPGGGYGIPMVAWEVPNAELDMEYEITIGGLTGQNETSVTYRTTLVDCN